MLHNIFQTYLLFEQWIDKGHSLLLLRVSAGVNPLLNHYENGPVQISCNGFKNACFSLPKIVKEQQFAEMSSPQQNLFFHVAIVIIYISMDQSFLTCMSKVRHLPLTSES